MHHKFWKVYPEAIEKSLHHVSDKCAVVELRSVDPWFPNSWGCIDKSFSVGYVFGYASSKEYAIKKCQNLAEHYEVDEVSLEELQAAADYYDKLMEEEP